MLLVILGAFAQPPQEECHTTPPPNQRPAEIGCSDLGVFEIPAIMGQLYATEEACLEARYAAGDARAEVSALLLRNAQGRGDKQAFLRLTDRHLREVSPGDAAAHLEFAELLERQHRREAAVEWADRAIRSGRLDKNQLYTAHALRSRVTFSAVRQADDALTEMRARALALEAAQDAIAAATAAGVRAVDAEQACLALAHVLECD